MLTVRRHSSLILSFSVKRLTELTENPEEFNAQNVKPKAYDMPPLQGESVVDAINLLEHDKGPQTESN